MARTRTSSPLDGILLVDKDTGWTSHDVVAKSRGITRQRRIGHTGTLDPAATGLLVLCLGRATRLVEFMSGHDKTYEGEIALGRATDTDDAEGTVIAEHPVPADALDRLPELAVQFHGEQLQVPPAYSAVKIDGQRAYAVARKGGEVALAPRPVVVYEIELEPTGPERVAIRVTCGSGTYVRSLARDIGARLGCGAHLATLRRTHAGPFRVDEAVTIEELDQINAREQLGDILRAPDEGVMDLDAVVLANERGAFLANGQPVFARTQPWYPAATARLYRFDGSFVGMGSVDDDGAIRAAKVIDTASSS